MDLYIKIIVGPRADDIFKVQPGITLGRSKADIHLKDNKASGTHGKFVEENGLLYYVDLKSTNGSFVQNKEIDKVLLEPGLVIKIGNTEFEVVTEFEVKKPEKANLSEWREALFGFVKDLKTNQVQVPVKPFEHCVSIEVKSGIQAGTGWILGYGPRIIGPGSSDICVLDETLSEMVLKISQHDEDIVIESISDEDFLVNGEKKNTEILKDRLKIQVGNTILEFGFIK